MWCDISYSIGFLNCQAHLRPGADQVLTTVGGMQAGGVRGGRLIVEGEGFQLVLASKYATFSQMSRNKFQEFCQIPPGLQICPWKTVLSSLSFCGTFPLVRVALNRGGEHAKTVVRNGLYVA